MDAPNLCRVDTPRIVIEARTRLRGFVATGCAAAASAPRTLPSLTLLPLFASVSACCLIAGQLFFLIALNLLTFLEAARPQLKDRRFVEWLFPGWSRQEGHAYDAAQVVNGLTNRWAELTGQPQDWSLFAPNVTDMIPFLA